MATQLTTGQDLPPPQVEFVDPKTGFLTQDGYKFFTNLINQLSQAQPTATVAIGLAATGKTQATALQLSAQWNEVDSLVNGGNGVLLSSLQPGQSQTVINESGAAINVYPPVGIQIDALGINEPYALASGSRVTFDFVSAEQIRS